MSSSKTWRLLGRTETPNARQKRNRLYIDAHPTCERCEEADAQEAHHELPKGHPKRNDWQNVKALCVQCHVAVHQH